jgi:hypothetical protein
MTVRFQVLMAASMTMIVLKDTVLCSLVEVDRRFTRTYCLHHRGDGPDYGGRKHVWNVGQFLPDYTAQHPRRRSSWLLYVQTMTGQTSSQVSSFKAAVGTSDYVYHVVGIWNKTAGNEKQAWQHDWRLSERGHPVQRDLPPDETQLGRWRDGGQS